MKMRGECMEMVGTSFERSVFVLARWTLYPFRRL